ncbi:MAG: GPI anchored serine-threonine rich family protein, partial [Candidatus Omnitrophica bacterium]|nr:GPI anchored serine-threonine rich family protein [Candidatus Omnitrophota bacterium]
TNTSTATFNIIGNVSVISPNGNENWPVGTTQYIFWSAAAVNQMNVSYSLNNGGAWTSLAVVGASGGNYTWNIPEDFTVSNQAKVRVHDNTNLLVNDTSNSTLNFIAYFNVTTPENGDVVVAEEPYSITWAKKGTGVDDVVLEYSTNGGANWTYVVAAGNHTVPNLGSYNWDPVPGTVLSTACKIKISDPNNANATDTGYGSFPIRGNLTLDTPVGSESWKVNTIHPVNWTRKGNIINVNISYSTDAGATYPTALATNYNASLGTWNWSIDNTTALTTQGRIKVADASNPSIVFANNTVDFEVKGNLDLTAPNNAGIVLTYGGPQYNITWVKYGAIAKAHLRYSNDTGSTYPDGRIIATNLTASTSLYAWTVPNDIGTNLTVKIIDAANPSVEDPSNNTFAIKGSIKLDQPNGGESWLKGTTQQIKWTPTGTYNGNVKLEYYNESITDWTQITNIASGADNTTQIFNWTVPDAISDLVKVRVTTLVNSTIDVTDESDSTFNITGSIDVISPNGAPREIWYYGDTNRQIKWNAVGTVTPVKIEYSTTNGGAWATLTSNFTGVEGPTNTYNWSSIPDRNSEACLIKVSDARAAFALVNDTSNATFSIRPNLWVITPVSGDNVVANSLTPINWDYTGTQITTVNIEYTTNNGVNWTTIEDNVPVASKSSYTWKDGVPAIATAQGKVRVYDSANANVTNTSTATFNIIGNVSVISPNGNENWPVGTTQYIFWSAAAVTQMNISYSLNNGGSWTGINVVPASNGNLTWNIPSDMAVSNQVKIKAFDNLNSLANDTSNSTFNITAYFNITDPENGHTVIAEEPYTISWDKNGTGVSDVILEYSTNAGLNWTYVVAAGNHTVPNTGFYNWDPVPGTTLTTTGKIRVTDPNNGNAADTGVGGFRIKGNITLTYPIGEESWQLNSIHPINWTRKGNIINVNISYSTDSGVTYPTALATNVNASSGTWNWSITDATPLTNKGRIKVVDSSDPSITYANNSVDFEVKGSLDLLTPNATSIVLTYGGPQYNITWAKHGAITKVNLRYSNDAGLTYPAGKIIATNLTASTGKEPWTVPNDIGTNLTVKVIDMDNPSVEAYSIYPFAIKGSIKLDQPNGG